ncbi:MAG TPA: DUF1569 domain-containing protein [Longimicrobium sp.]|nr:DUF1569 domain-containing protein [Longimicrobium sp.]
MKTVFDAGMRGTLLERFGRITPERRPLWGAMDAPRMVAHLNDALRMGLGELPTEPVGNAILRNPLVSWLLINVLPWPKGTPTAPELLAAPPGAWDADTRVFRELLERVGAAGPRAGWPAHPIFGRLSGKRWGELVYRHVDHHLRQFGA